MESLATVAKYLIANWDTMIASAALFVNGAIALALIIPGAEPERTLSRIANGLSKISRKPKN
jgi:hypothetical protein